MNKKPLFSIASDAPQPGALERMLAVLHARQQHSRLWRVRVFAVSTLLSAAALVPAVMALIKAFAVSNFATYVSLLCSDGFVAGFWKEIVASLIESLPAVSLALTVALIGTLLWSVRGMVRFTGAHLHTA